MRGVQADITPVVRHGRSCVLKSPRTGLLKPFSRWTLAREAAVYRQLENVAGIPACLGLESECLLLESVDGRPLSEFRKGEISTEFLDALDRILLDIHSRGVAHSDLKKRANILVVESKKGRKGESRPMSETSALGARPTPEAEALIRPMSETSALGAPEALIRQRPVIVDFGAAFMKGEILFDTFRRVDLAAAAKLRAHHQPQTIRPDQKILLDHPTWAERLSRFLIHTIRDPFRWITGQR